MTRLLQITLLLLAGPAFAMSFSYDIVLKNKLSSSVHVTLRQYHAVGFDGTRPPAWTDELLNHSTDGELSSGEVETVTFSDARGGFWVVWSASDPATGRVLCEGEGDFTRGDSPYSVELDPEACTGTRQGRTPSNKPMKTAVE